MPASEKEERLWRRSGITLLVSSLWESLTGILDKLCPMESFSAELQAYRLYRPNIKDENTHAGSQLISIWALQTTQYEHLRLFAQVTTQEVPTLQRDKLGLFCRRIVHNLNCELRSVRGDITLILKLHSKRRVSRGNDTAAHTGERAAAAAAAGSDLLMCDSSRC